MQGLRFLARPLRRPSSAATDTRNLPGLPGRPQQGCLLVLVFVQCVNGHQRSPRYELPFWPALRTPANTPGRPRGQLESVLGTTPAMAAAQARRTCLSPTRCVNKSGYQPPSSRNGIPVDLPSADREHLARYMPGQRAAVKLTRVQGRTGEKPSAFTPSESRSPWEVPTSHLSR